MKIYILGGLGIGYTLSANSKELITVTFGSIILLFANLSWLLKASAEPCSFNVVRAAHKAVDDMVRADFEKQYRRAPTDDEVQAAKTTNSPTSPNYARLQNTLRRVGLKRCAELLSGTEEEEKKQKAKNILDIYVAPHTLFMSAADVISAHTEVALYVLTAVDPNVEVVIEDAEVFAMQAPPSPEKSKRERSSRNSQASLRESGPELGVSRDIPAPPSYGDPLSA